MSLTEFRSFLTAGDAVFTLTSRRTGDRYTYRVARVENMQPRFPRYFISVLTGSDNTRDYTYAGMMRLELDRLVTYQTRGSKIDETAPSWRGFVWLVIAVNTESDISEQAEIDHLDRCGRCGRALTVPESIRTGLGPECARILGVDRG